MTRPTDPRGANRRGSDNSDLGYDIANDAPAKPTRLPMRQRREPAPDCGCYGYEWHGTMYTRCKSHAPAGAVRRGRVRGQCVACVAEGMH